MQCALSFAFPWAAYYTSEGLELSGIVTILFCGATNRERTPIMGPTPQWDPAHTPHGTHTPWDLPLPTHPMGPHPLLQG